MGKLETMMDFALSIAKWSKCTEGQVGAVITTEDFTEVLAIGYNGGPARGHDCLCNIEGKYGCVHAEINALIKCRDTHKNKVMFVTLSPCKQCATAIINAGLTKVYIRRNWKDLSGMKLLATAGIEVIPV